jgi:hypothetical protein
VFIHDRRTNEDQDIEFAAAPLRIELCPDPDPDPDPRILRILSPRRALLSQDLLHRNLNCS